ncbi:radical SAM protein [Enterococcus sp. DIV0840c]|uniref:radical SAM protein n=1 Tax=Enterococcus sp. DIV0840c TaxID=2774772 RepID=UPI003D2BF6E3
MKLSQYTIVEEVDNEILLYNSVYSAIVLLTQSEFHDLQTFINNDNLEKTELFSYLENQNIIVSDEIDEEARLVSVANEKRYNPSQVTFTIAPTMNCNFSCFYCYEQGFRQHTMTTETAKKTAEFILKNVLPHQSLKVIWYGGEPLMGLNSIKVISEIIMKNEKKYKNFNAEIVSNGYLLTEKVAQLLKSYHVNYAQITLDGDQINHDSRRCLTNGKGTFARILQNIVKTLKYIPVTVRVNIDRENNHEDVIRLMNSLDNFNLLKKVGFYLAPVEDFDTYKTPTCYTSQEFSKEEIMVYKSLLERGINIVAIPRTTIGFCEAINRDDYVIDPNGFLYKCWVHIGKTIGRVGDIYTGIQLNSVHKTFTEYKFFSKAKCSSCKVQPLCLGGCPLIRMNTGESKCLSYKYKIEEHIKMASARLI